MIFFQYLAWHFIDVPRAFGRAWRNYLYFVLNYFSVPLLLKTFFSHWRRYASSYGKGFNPRRYVEALVFNAMSRVIGMILRTLFIILGIGAEAFIFCAGLIILMLWIILPVLLVAGFVFGIRLINYV